MLHFICSGSTWAPCSAPSDSAGESTSPAAGGTAATEAAETEGTRCVYMYVCVCVCVCIVCGTANWSVFAIFDIMIALATH